MVHNGRVFTRLRGKPMLSLMLRLAAAPYGTTTSKLAAPPERAWIQQSETGQALSLDILAESPTDAPLDVDEVQVSVYRSATQERLLL